MEKKHIITIGGLLGSGKSSAARLVAEKLAYTHYSAGDLMRQLAKENGYDDIRDFNLASEGTTSADDQVDERTRQIGETGSNIVFDGHMSWRFIPGSFKVFLTLDSQMAAERILGSMTPERKASEHVTDDASAYAKLLDERKSSNVRRYEALYGVDPYRPDYYDCVIDTRDSDLEEVAEKIINAYELWLKD